ncbi:DUF948 domain-containing protein [Bacillus sp. T33-2]|uniref:DUF948 domain-containing protein n=1 Tax=Bacillus sp. T33-2 TaxID=2054168 RepID=UPI000C790AE4|nr:DUF948 domain-containing protein [Bacillus sp. T33-2]PLR96935.1 DUF948 domain-containing protein [Bacillus sp. T33-2]
MIIVYLSLALIAASIGYLGYYAFKTLKAAKPAMDSLSETAARVQAKTATLKVETDKLTENQQQLMSDIEQKKQAFTQTIDKVKQTPKVIKQAIKATPVSLLERKYRFRQWKLLNKKRQLS